MAYTRPMVMVFQEYKSTSISTQAAELPPCIVGPCFHIIDPVEDEALALYGRYTTEGVEHAFFPNNRPGAIIDPESVFFRFKNAVVLVKENAALAASANTSNIVRFADSSFFDTLEIGDAVEIVVNGVPNALRLRIIGINKSNSTLLLNRTCTVDADSTVINIYRTIEEVLISGSDKRVLLDVSSERFDIMGIDWDDVDESTGTVRGTYRITSAELYVGYRALRQDLSDIFTVYSIDEIEGKIGKIHRDNPLAYGVSIAMANASIGIKCIGVDSDDLAGYTAAKDRMENHDPLYSIVPLTMSPGILSMFKQHAIEMSDPKNGMWRIVFGCSPLVTEKVVSEGVGELSRDGDGDFVVLRATTEESAFLSNSIDSGDKLYITDAQGEEHVYIVSTVASDDLLTIVQSDPFDPALFFEGDRYSFKVQHRFDKLGQAKEIANTSRSYGSQRFIHIWPDICVVNEKEEPGYYLGCAVAAGVGGLPSHYGFTRLSLGGIDGVKHANDYFNNDQLDTIADGGTFIFIQSSQTSPPHIRHQLTTDRSITEMQELSFVKNFDYVSYICKQTMDQFIGKYNVTKSTLGTLKSALEAILEQLKLDTQPKIGSRVLDYTVTSVQQLEGMADRVEMYADIAMPYPLNTIGLHLNSYQLVVTSS